MQPDSIPTAAQRAAMVTRLVALGYTSTALATIIRAGVSRKQIAADLIAMQRQAQKA